MWLFTLDHMPNNGLIIVSGEEIDDDDGETIARSKRHGSTRAWHST
jgi:hypothetical protein